MKAGKKWVAASVFLHIVFLCPGVCFSQEVSQQAHSSSDSRPNAVFPLARAIPLPMLSSERALAIASQKFRAFKHEPFETAGFNQLVIPFHYEDLDGTGDPNEANAFAFLLSADLDWAPGSYCARHAYFTFKRSREDMLKLADHYDPELISDLIYRWDATHAMGGVLRCSKDGYTGCIKVFDSKGKVVFTKEYDTPQSFFHLLGDVSADIMTFLGYPPSDKLRKHLRIQRCKSRQSLIELGQAAFLPQWSAEEFDLYESIIRRDPGFANVRHWLGNQGGWADLNEGQCEIHKGLALKSYMTTRTLVEFSISKCPDKKLTSNYDRWMSEYGELAGESHPEVCYARLKRASLTGKTPPRSLLEHATKVASMHPNQHWLLWYLGTAYSQRQLEEDYHMAASVFIAAVKDRFVTNQGDKRDCLDELGWNLHNSGEYVLAASLLAPHIQSRLSDDNAYGLGNYAHCVALSLTEMGRYAESMRYYRIDFKDEKRSEKRQMDALVSAAAAAAMAEQKDVLDQILRDRYVELQRAHAQTLVEAYRDFLLGNTIDFKPLFEDGKHYSWNMRCLLMLLRAQDDLRNGTQKARKDLKAFLNFSAHKRSFWILYDGYDRRWPENAAADFYEALKWLHPEDLWVQKAANDFAKRTKSPQLQDPEALLKRFKDYAPIRWPQHDPKEKKKAAALNYSTFSFSVASATKQLLDARDFDRAHELALRYRHLAVAANNWGVRTFCNHLIYLVEYAREDHAKASATERH